MPFEAIPAHPATKKNHRHDYQWVAGCSRLRCLHIRVDADGLQRITGGDVLPLIVAGMSTSVRELCVDLPVEEQSHPFVPTVGRCV